MLSNYRLLWARTFCSSKVTNIKIALFTQVG